MREKTNNLGSTMSDTNRADVYSHRRYLVAENFGLRKLRNGTIRVAKTKELICAFVFAYADCWFSHAAGHIQKYNVCYF